MEILTLGLFCAALVACLILDVSILFALAFGLLIFLLYGRRKGFTWRALSRMAIEGVRTIRNILVTFLLIGILTALWRAAGTIPVIVCYASALIRPSVFLLMTFLLNCAVSVLTGTAFGTSATMGVICATMGATMGVDPRLVGGAVLSGVYFGDRCSPVSTSALLVAELTGTHVMDNIPRMLRTALVPFLLACGIYALLGRSSAQAASSLDLWALFGSEFALRWTALIPAAVILLLSALRVNVKRVMLASILTALPLCMLLQHHSLPLLLRMAVLGFRASDPAVGTMIDGGGIASMLKVAGIVCLSASYSGIFQRTGLLDGAKHSVEALSKKATRFGATLITACVAGMLACNQTLSIMLTHQLCGEVYADPPALALDLEDTAVVIAPLIPWCIASGIPLATIGAPLSAIPLACYLYLLPLCRLGAALMKRGKAGNADSPRQL